MQKKIKFGETEINVTNCYPFKYSNGKIVLRVSASEEEVDESTLKLLKTNTEDILYFEAPDVEVLKGDSDGNTETCTEVGEYVLKATYENYTSGDYTSSYSNGIYEAEITRIGETEAKVKILEEDMTELVEQLALTNEALELANANLEFVALMADVEI